MSGWSYQTTVGGWSPQRLQEATAGLDALPTTFGAWERVRVDQLAGPAAKMLRCQLSADYTYRHRDTGELITVTILLAPAATLSVHSPEVCYASSNYEVQESRQRITVNEAQREHAFWRVVLEPSDEQNRPLAVYYGWLESSAWIAPQQERFYFAGHGGIYKLQVASFARTDGSDHGQMFLKEFLPVLQNHLVVGEVDQEES